MFNFSFFKCYQKEIAFCIFIFMITANFSLSQANAITANNSNNIYKHKIYSNIEYMNIDTNMDIMFYGVGAETKLPNSIEILCNYATGSAQLKKDMEYHQVIYTQGNPSLVTLFSKKQKTVDISNSIFLSAKHYYNDFLFQSDFIYAQLGGDFKFYGGIQNNEFHDVMINMDINMTYLRINLGKKFIINDNLYLFPQCCAMFYKMQLKNTSINIDSYTVELNKATKDIVFITPELVIGGDLFLSTAIKINPEISFSFLFDTSDSSNNKLHINPKIQMEINRFYVAGEVHSITESDGRAFLIKLGVLF